jgi:hypothetical protein
MSRVADDDVTPIIDTTIEPAPFIQMATVLVDEYLTGKGLSDPLLFEIERLLAAHFLCLRDPRENEIELGTQEARVKFEGKYGTGLKFTRYGQQAEALDPTGVLANSSKPAATLLVMSEYDTT